jgi:WD40 repeat protein
MKIWDMNSGQCIRSLPGYAPAVLSRDGRYAISGGPTGEFSIWAVHCNDKPYGAPYQICRDIAVSG